jgi:RNA polymerase sigma-70 factor, ECF subfamily
LLAELVAHESEIMTLLELMLLHDARRATRISLEGVLIPLEEQERTRWNRDVIAQGLAFLDSALALRRVRWARRAGSLESVDRPTRRTPHA